MPSRARVVRLAADRARETSEYVAEHCPGFSGLRDRRGTPIANNIAAVRRAIEAAEIRLVFHKNAMGTRDVENKDDFGSLVNFDLSVFGTLDSARRPQITQWKTFPASLF